ncbi:MAG: DNA-methyltransferase [Spirochaetia bacterium]
MKGKSTEKTKRLDTLSEEDRVKYLSCCRLHSGETWEDSVSGHRVSVADAGRSEAVISLMNGTRPDLVVADPPYNVKLNGKNTPSLGQLDIEKYQSFSKNWMNSVCTVLEQNAHVYIWLGCDYKNGFQPLPEFMLLMREFTELVPRNFITMRNQRGYGTQKNWMWVRQELLHYVKGEPSFSVAYTEIPKIVKGYYKTVSGKKTENMERSKSETIRPGNVWVDIQQVFYRMQENVPGCFAQKPLKAIQRIIVTSSQPGGVVFDPFCHSGTTLIAGEMLGRTVYTMDIDPIFAELAIRRLENFRKTGRTGWQWHEPFGEI